MINKIFILLAIGLFFASPVLAQSDLSVSFGKDPLFEDENILPGDKISSNVTINNQTGQKQELGVSTNIMSNDGLESQLRFFVKDGTQETDCGTIASLDNNNWCSFGEIENNSQKTFELIVIFEPNAGDNYQGKSVNFDVAVGAYGVLNGGNETPSGGGQTYGTIAVMGAGGPSAPQGLYIFNEREKEVSGTSATITWQTNYLSTTHIIYGEKSGVFDLSQGAPYYGYEFYKEGDDTGIEKVTFHQITIDGLKPNTTYYYRCVSMGSLAISDPYEFTTSSSFEQVGGDTPVSDNDVVITPPDYRGPIGQGSETSSPSQGEGLAEDLLAQDDILQVSQWQEESDDEKGIFGSLFAAIGRQSICLLLILAIALFIMLFFFSIKNGKIEKKRIYWVLMFLAIGLFVLYSFFCPYWKIVGAVMLVVSLVVYIAMMLKA